MPNPWTDAAMIGVACVVTLGAGCGAHNEHGADPIAARDAAHVADDDASIGSAQDASVGEAAVDAGSELRPDAASDASISDAASDAAKDGSSLVAPGDAGPQTYCGKAGEIIMLVAAPDVAGCTWIRGSVYVQDWSQGELPLGKIVGIDGDLRFFRPHSLENFRGLERLQRVGGRLDVHIDNNGMLTSMDGFSALSEVGSLALDNLYRLTSLSGLSALTSVKGDLTIRDNEVLPKAQVDALLARVRVGGTVDVSGNKP